MLSNCAVGQDIWKYCEQPRKQTNPESIELQITGLKLSYTEYIMQRIR